MDIFSSTFGSFILTCDNLPNLDENDTLFYIENEINNNHPKLDGCGHPFLEVYFEV